MTFTWDMIKRIEFLEVQEHDVEYDEHYTVLEARFYLNTTTEETIKLLDSSGMYPLIQSRLDYINGDWRTPEVLADAELVAEILEEIEEYKLEDTVNFTAFGKHGGRNGEYHLEGGYILFRNYSFHHYFQHAFDWMPDEMRDIIYHYKNSKAKIGVYIEDGVEYPVTCGMIDGGFMYPQSAIDELFQGSIGKYLKEEAAKIESPTQKD